MQATRTYLELSRETQFKPGFGAFPDLVIERVERPTPELYRECYRSVGEAYHWRDRWDWTDAEIRTDRKSTRLNSSHDQISYAVFCLKKKKKTDCPSARALSHSL